MSIKINHLTSLHLFGKIKSITERKSKPDWLVRGSKKDTHNFDVSTEVSTFNRNGYLISRNIYDYKGTLKQENFFKYNSRQNLTEHITKLDGSIESRMEYYYNNSDVAIRSKYYLWNDFLIEDCVCLDINTGGNEKTFCYDDKGNIDHIVYDTINEKGLITEFKVCKPDGRVTGGYASVYDDQNRERKRVFPASQFYNKLVIIYDEWHNEIEELLYDPGNILHKHRKFVYKFDDYNNWIEKTIIENGMPEEVFERNIRYF